MKKSPIEGKYPSDFTPSHTIETEDGQMNIYEVHPADPVSDVSVLVSPGFTQGPDTTKGLIRQLGKQRHTVMTDMPGGRPSAIRERQLDGESEHQQGKAMTHVDTMEQLGLDRVDAIGHSEGCVNLIMAAALYPEKFRNIVLVNPSGLVGGDDAATTALRFVQHKRDVAGRFEENPELQKADEVGKVERDGNFTRDLGKTLDATIDLAAIKMEEIMAIAKANGVKIAIIHTSDDKLYPIGEVKKMNKRYRKQLRLDEIEPGTTQEQSEEELIDKFYEYPGTHNDFYLKQKQYDEYCQQALRDLQAKRELEEAL